MSQRNWNLTIDMSIDGNDFHYGLTMSEPGLLDFMRQMYGMFESKLIEIANRPSGSRPLGLLDDLLVLNRCLVFDKLSEHDGKFVKISRK